MGWERPVGEAVRLDVLASLNEKCTFAVAMDLELAELWRLEEVYQTNYRNLQAAEAAFDDQRANQQVHFTYLAELKESLLSAASQDIHDKRSSANEAEAAVEELRRLSLLSGRYPEEFLRYCSEKCVAVPELGFPYVRESDDPLSVSARLSNLPAGDPTLFAEAHAAWLAHVYDTGLLVESTRTMYNPDYSLELNQLIAGGTQDTGHGFFVDDLICALAMCDEAVNMDPQPQSNMKRIAVCNSTRLFDEAQRNIVDGILQHFAGLKSRVIDYNTSVDCTQFSKNGDSIETRETMDEVVVINIPSDRVLGHQFDYVFVIDHSVDTLTRMYQRTYTRRMDGELIHLLDTQFSPDVDYASLDAPSVSLITRASIMSRTLPADSVIIDPSGDLSVSSISRMIDGIDEQRRLRQERDTFAACEANRIPNAIHETIRSRIPTGMGDSLVTRHRAIQSQLLGRKDALFLVLHDQVEGLEYDYTHARQSVHTLISDTIEVDQESLLEDVKRVKDALDDGGKCALLNSAEGIDEFNYQRMRLIKERIVEGILNREARITNGTAKLELKSLLLDTRLDMVRDHVIAPLLQVEFLLIANSWELVHAVCSLVDPLVDVVIPASTVVAASGTDLFSLLLDINEAELSGIGDCLATIGIPKVPPRFAPACETVDDVVRLLATGTMTGFRHVMALICRSNLVRVIKQLSKFFDAQKRELEAKFSRLNEKVDSWSRENRACAMQRLVECIDDILSA